MDKRLEVPASSRAVILAAGRGRRMAAITDDRPKCLLRVGDRTLLDHQIETLRALGISRISVVVGYRAEQVRAAVGGGAEIIHNEVWAETNSLYSTWLCREPAACEPLLVLNGDVLAHPAIIERVGQIPGSAFAYDSTSGDEAEHMKVELAGEVLRAMRKDLTRDRVCGENVGILGFEGPAPALLFEEAEALLEAGGRQLWLAAAVERVACRLEMRGVDVADLPWCEIDFPEDLWTARRTTWPALRACEWRPGSPAKGPGQPGTFTRSGRAARS